MARTIIPQIWLFGGPPRLWKPVVPRKCGMEVPRGVRLVSESAKTHKGSLDFILPNLVLDQLCKQPTRAASREAFAHLLKEDKFQTKTRQRKSAKLYDMCPPCGEKSLHTYNTPDIHCDHKVDTLGSMQLFEIPAELTID